MRIKKPIFIIGSGRSGTTILYKLLSIHPEVCWFSNYSDIFPNNPFLPILHRIIDIPLIGKELKKANISFKPHSLIPKPSEGNNIYHLL